MGLATATEASDARAAAYIADQLTATLETAEPDMGVICKHKTNSGLVKYQPKGDPADWAAAAKGILATEKPDAIVVMLGLDDRQPIREAAADKSDKESQAGCKIGCQGRQDRRSETRHRREAR